MGISSGEAVGRGSLVLSLAYPVCSGIRYTPQILLCGNSTGFYIKELHLGTEV